MVELFYGWVKKVDTGFIEGSMACEGRVTANHNSLCQFRIRVESLPIQTRCLSNENLMFLILGRNGEDKVQRESRTNTLVDYIV